MNGDTDSQAGQPLTRRPLLDWPDEGPHDHDRGCYWDLDRGAWRCQPDTPSNRVDAKPAPACRAPAL
jgi:hypothetical protein